MSAVAFVLLVVFVLATLGVLATGVFGMMKGGEFNEGQSGRHPPFGATLD